MLNVRLDKDLEKKLRLYAEDNDLSKTSIVKEALVQYFKKNEISDSPFALGEDLFGGSESLQGDLSKTYKSKIKSKLGEKHAH